MKKKFSLFIILLSVVAFVSCASSGNFVKQDFNFHNLDRIAVVVDGKVSEARAKEISDLVAMRMLEYGYDVIDRANLEQIINEADFQSFSGIASSQGRKTLAIYNVGALVVVNVSAYESSRISMTSKMIDVQTGSILWTSEASKASIGKATNLLISLGGTAAGAGIGYAVGRDATATIVGGLLGGTLTAGGMFGLGALFTKDQAELTRATVKKLTNNLPNLILN